MKQSEEQVASVQLENKNKVPTIILYLVKDLLLYYGIAFLFFFVQVMLGALQKITEVGDAIAFGFR